MIIKKLTNVKFIFSEKEKIHSTLQQFDDRSNCWISGKYELDKHTNAYRRKEIWELIHKDFVEQTGADHLQIFQVQKKWQNFMAEIKRNPNNEQNILASFDNPDHFMESSMVEDR